MYTGLGLGLTLAPPPWYSLRVPPPGIPAEVLAEGGVIPLVSPPLVFAPLAGMHPIGIHSVSPPWSSTPLGIHSFPPPGIQAEAPEEGGAEAWGA